MKKKGHCNYRIVKHSDHGFYVHEVYYTNKGKPHAMSDAMHPYGDTIDELADDLGRMMMSITRGVFVPPKRWGKK